MIPSLHDYQSPFFQNSQIYHLGKKRVNFGGNILVESQPILKKHMRFGIARDFAQLCSFICLEVLIKTNRKGKMKMAKKELFIHLVFGR